MFSTHIPYNTKRLNICATFDLFSIRCGKALSDKASDNINQQTPQPSPSPNGLQLGAVVSLNIYVGTVNGSSVARERCSPLQKQEEHIDL